MNIKENTFSTFSSENSAGGEPTIYVFSQDTIKSLVYLTVVTILYLFFYHMIQHNSKKWEI